MNSNKTNKLKISQFGIIFCIFLLCLTFLMQSPLNFCAKYGNSAVDSSVFRTVATYMENGGMPYRDTFDHKGPLLYILNYLGMVLLDFKGIWLIELIGLFITFIYMYKTARLCLGKVASLLSVVVSASTLHLFFQGGNLTEEYAMPFIAISLFIFVDYFLNKKVSKIRLITCGFSFAAVCLLRINMISLWCVFCVMILIKSLVEKSYKELWQFILFFVIGMGILVIPIFAWLIINDAFSEFINDYFIFNSMYVSNSTTTASINKIINLINRYLPLKLTSNSTCLCMILTSAFFTVNPATFISLLFAIISFMKDKKSYFNIGYLFYILLTIILVSMSGKIYPHYGMILVPLAIYPISKVIEYIKNNLRLKRTMLLGTLLFLSVIGFFVYGSKNVVFRDDESSKDILVANFVKQNSNPNSEITVFGNCNVVYLISGRKPASKYSYQFPIGTVNPEIMDEYFEEITLSQPEIIVCYNELERMNSFLENEDYLLIKEISGIKIYKKVGVVNYV